MKQSSGKTTVKMLGKRVPLPNSVLLRRLTGILFTVGGVFGFLPVLGFWMIPIGLVILSHDSATIRRIRRKMDIKILRFFCYKRKSKFLK